MKRSLLPLALLALLASACGSGTEPAAPPAGGDSPAAAAAVELSLHQARCGCSLAEVGHCGNYVEVGGKYVQLVHPSLGTMEYCNDGETGAQIEVAGELKDGKLVASSYKRVN
ncbi:MAG: hypothetical protein AB1726_02310 [Planctomycetota bacterium]